MKKWILVTGGCGSIGERLVRSLLDKGDYGVINLDRALCPRSDSDDYRFIKGDIRTFEFEPLFKDFKISYIVHLAAESDERGSFSRVLDFHETNVSATLRLLEAARAHNVSHTILLSSIAVKASNGQQVKTPRSPYAATKLAGELFAEVHARLHEVPITVFRLSDLYGQGVEGSELQDLLDQCHHEDTIELCATTRYFFPVHIDDVVTGLEQVLSNGDGYRLFELGDPQRISDEEIVSVLSRILNKQFDIDRAKDRRAFNGENPDPEKFFAVIGIDGFRDIRSGLAHALDG